MQNVEMWGRDVGDISGHECHDIYVVQLKEVPVSVRVKSGMLLNETRSVLDALACMLANRNVGANRETSFPVCRDEQAFRDKRAQKKISRLSESDRCLIARHKPWAGGNDDIFLLHEIDRQRKHVRLSACATESMALKLADGRILSNPGFYDLLIDEKVPGWFRAGHMAGGKVGVPQRVAGNIPVALPFQLRTGVSFSDPPEVRHREVVPMIRDSVDAVGAILNSFR
jgi:hypothetical protein